MTDALLIAECARVEALARREHAAWARLARFEERYRMLEPDQQAAAVSGRSGINAAYAVADRWNGRLIEAARKLTFTPPSTRAGLEAKARAWLTMRQLAPREMSFEWATDLAEMVIRETVMLEVAA